MYLEENCVRCIGCDYIITLLKFKNKISNRISFNSRERRIKSELRRPILLSMQSRRCHYYRCEIFAPRARRKVYHACSRTRATATGRVTGRMHEVPGKYRLRYRVQFDVFSFLRSLARSSSTKSSRYHDRLLQGASSSTDEYATHSIHLCNGREL